MGTLHVVGNGKSGKVHNRHSCAGGACRCYRFWDPAIAGLFVFGFCTLTWLAYLGVSSSRAHEAAGSLHIVSADGSGHSALARRSLTEGGNTQHVATPRAYVPVASINHTVVVMTTTGRAGRPARNVAELYAAASPTFEPVNIVWLKGPGAIGDAIEVEVGQLPAVAYLPPHCVIATCGQPSVLPLETGAYTSGKVPTTVKDVADWLFQVAGRQPLLMANDHPTATVRFSMVYDPYGFAVNFDVKPGKRTWTMTWLKTQWIAKPLQQDEYGRTNAVWGKLTVKGDSQLVIRDPDDCSFFTDPHCTLPPPPVPQWGDELLKIRQREFDRIKLDNLVQKGKIKKYTAAGFEKRRGPPEIFNLLLDYFYAHNHTSVNEFWSEESVYVNHEASRFQIIEMPEEGSMRSTLFELIRPVFEAWAPGSAPLEPAAIYGIRTYFRGSTLQDHSDRPDTHVISCIMNIAQDVDELWPLEIFGHDGHVSQYEGASCAHGRRRPLNGRFMANVFMHMRPTNSAEAQDSEPPDPDTAA